MCSPSKSGAWQDSQRGFTLLEMLLVMILMGLLISVAFPRMQSWYESMAARQESAAVLTQLRQLPARAAAQGSQLQLGAQLKLAKNAASGVRPVIDLPPTWGLVSDGGVIFLPSGLCRAGVMQFERKAAAAEAANDDAAKTGQMMRLQVSAGLCEMEWLS